VTETADTNAIRERLAAIPGLVAEATAAWRKGELPLAAYGEATRQLESEQAELGEALVSVSQVSVLNPYAGRPGALAAAWEGLPTEVRRQIIADTLDLRAQRIVVEPGEHRKTNRKVDTSDAEWIRAEWGRVHWQEAAEAVIAA